MGKFVMRFYQKCGRMVLNLKGRKIMKKGWETEKNEEENEKVDVSCDVSGNGCYPDSNDGLHSSG